MVGIRHKMACRRHTTSSSRMEVRTPERPRREFHAPFCMLQALPSCQQLHACHPPCHLASRVRLDPRPNLARPQSAHRRRDCTPPGWPGRPDLALVPRSLPSHAAVCLSRALAGDLVPHFDSLACSSVASALAQRCAHHTLTPSHHHLTTLSLSPSPRLLPRPSPYSRPTYDPPGPDLSTISRAGDVAGLISHLHFNLYALVAALWGPADGNGTGISLEVCDARARTHPSRSRGCSSLQCHVQSWT